jgi:uncharacterized protein (DUF1015 family)
LVLDPFRGVRFAADRVGDLAAVTSPPYDMLDAETVAALRSTAPHNVVRLILPRDTNPGAGLDQTGRYRQAGELFRGWRAESVLVTDAAPALYVYEQAGAVRQRGLIGALGLREPEERVVLPHEDVQPGPVADRLALMEACEANLEPILLVYDGGGAASSVVERTASGAPLFTASTADGIEHRLWPVTSPADLAAIAADLSPRQALIADGHHRYATYRKLRDAYRQAGAGDGPWDFGLALLVDQSAYPVRVSAIHRTVAGLPLDKAVSGLSADFAPVPFGSDSAAARAALAACAEVLPGFLLTDGASWVLLRGPAYASELELDIELLQAALERRFGLDDAQVGYAHDEPSALRAAHRGGGIAILVNPVDVATVRRIAEAGGRMPRKSTSFGPKPRTGFVMRAFHEQT